MPREKMPDVIVLLPGILGSVLKKGGRDVWAASGSAALMGLLSRGGTLRELALEGDSPDDDLGDGVVADRLMPDVHMIPGLWKIDGYTKIRQQIATIFDVKEGENYFEFPYDWRRDLRVAAKRLERESQGWLDRWRDKSGNSDARLVLVAHSMGGLVSRYFLEVLGGWSLAKALITFGTPHRGAVNALEALVNGARRGPFGAFDLSDFARSLTSTYQLLPIYRCYDGGDGILVRVGETESIPNVDARRAAEALEFHREIMDAVEENRKREEYLNGGYRNYPIIGIEQPTLQSARRAVDAVEFLRTYQDEDRRGDGTVPRGSATPPEFDEAPRDEKYESTRHGSLQNADAALTQLRGVLLPWTPGDFLSPNLGKAMLGMEIEDAYSTREPVVVRVQPDREGIRLEASVTLSDSHRVVARASLLEEDNDGWQRAEFALPDEGIYRVTVSGNAAVEPVEDIFSVFEPAG